MLDNEDWVRLIEGLVTATVEERLDWQGDGTARSAFAALAAGIAASFSAGRERLTATTARSTYEISAAPGGLQPYGLSVWDRSNGSAKMLGSIESSVHSAMMIAGVNDALRRLWDAATASIEPGDVIVNRLLDDLNG